MATDWLVYLLTHPLGLALIAFAIAAPFLVWRSVLGPAFTEIGIKPLAFAYTCALVGLAVMSLGESYVEFDRRVAVGILQEAARWSTVPGWTFYITILSLVVVLPLLGLLGTPVSAALLKNRRLTPRNIVVATVVVWVLLAVLLWAYPANEWHRTHRLASLAMSLEELGVGILFVALPFTFAIYSASRAFRREVQQGPVT